MANKPGRPKAPPKVNPDKRPAKIIRHDWRWVESVSVWCRQRQVPVSFHQDRFLSWHAILELHDSAGSFAAHVAQPDIEQPEQDEEDLISDLHAATVAARRARMTKGPQLVRIDGQWVVKNFGESQSVGVRTPDTDTDNR